MIELPLEPDFEVLEEEVLELELEEAPDPFVVLEPNK